MSDKTYTLTELITNLRKAGERLNSSEAPKDFKSADEAIGWTVASMLGYDIDSDVAAAEAAYREFDALLSSVGL